MITPRRSADRGHFNHGWLDTRHTFSFAGYQDSHFMGFRNLRVINQDIIKAGTGFGSHSHRDMEIITYVLRGTVEHRDSLGHREQIRQGEIQVMSAGTGITHSESNPSNTEDLELLQIWILPDQRGHEPRYAQREIQRHSDGLTLIVSPDPSPSTLKIHQDVKIYSGHLQAGKTSIFSVKANRHAWIQVIEGTLSVDGSTLHPGDGAAVTLETPDKIELAATTESHFLLFDLN